MFVLGNDERRGSLTIGRRQHISILPMSAQIVVKSETEVATVGAASKFSFHSSHSKRNRKGGKHLRTEQSRSATPRTSTSQHNGVSRAVEQIPVWRLLAGMASAVARRAVMVMNEYCILSDLEVSGRSN